MVQNNILFKTLDWLWLNWKYRGKCRVSYSGHLQSGTVCEGMNKIGENAKFKGRMGLGTYIGGDCVLKADVGRFTSIAPGVTSVTGRHPIKSPFATTSPFFYMKDISFAQSFATEDMYQSSAYYDSSRKILVKIGNDCWIGQGALLVGGICVGDGAVVLAHAVVTKDVEPYAIVGGVPARVIGYRYGEETIRFLLKRQWWNESEAWLREHWRLLTDIESLKKI